MRIKPWVELSDRQKGWRTAWFLMLPWAMAACILIIVAWLATL